MRTQLMVVLSLTFALLVCGRHDAYAAEARVDNISHTHSTAPAGEDVSIEVYVTWSSTTGYAGSLMMTEMKSGNDFGLVINLPKGTSFSSAKYGHTSGTGSRQYEGHAEVYNTTTFAQVAYGHKQQGSSH